MLIPQQVPKSAFLLKIQRLTPANSSVPKLMIYSRDNAICPTIVPDSGAYHEALGDRAKAWFACTKDAGVIHIGEEVYITE